MKIYGALNKFIYSKDKENPETLMKGKFFLASTFLFILMCAASIPYFIFYMPGEIINNPEVFYFNLILIILFIFFFPIYKRFGGRVLLINILTFFGWLGNITTYNVNGGIFSADCLWGIIISSWVFLVANKASGYFWMIVTLLTYVIFIMQKWMDTKIF